MFINWSFVIGLFVGGIVGVLIMCLMTASSMMDDSMLGDRQYDED